jgi:hypothetical protein
MLQEKEYHLKSVCPMLVHNGQLADPMNGFAKALKVITGKRSKTDADYEEMARIEFLGGLYMGEPEDGPVIPPANIRGMLIRAARKRKEGKLAEAGIFILDNSPLIYEGPRDADSLWEDESFRDRQIVVVGRNRVARTRPIFNEWAANVKVTYDDDVLNEAQLDEWFQIAGSIIGQGDYRPQYGRFEVLNGNGHK